MCMQCNTAIEDDYNFFLGCPVKDHLWLDSWPGPSFPSSQDMLWLYITKPKYKNDGLLEDDLTNFANLLDKRQRHSSFGNDLRVLKSPCTQHPSLSKIVANLQRQLVTVSHDKVNQHFWETTGPELTRVMLQGLPIKFDLKVELANSTIASMVSPSSGSSSSTTCASPTDRVIESDSSFVKSGLSIGTIIKRKARILLDQQRHGRALYPRERKIMSNGLSGILDIADWSYESQKSLFTSDEWCKITHIMKTRHLLKTPRKNLELANIWKVVCASVESSRNLNCGILNIYKMYQKYHGTNHMPGLRTMEHILDIIGNYPHLLKRNPDVGVSEYDYLTFLWNQDGRNMLPFSANNKREQHHDGTQVTGFKIDLRCLVDVSKTEDDICSMEVCCNDINGDKIIANEGKLNREMQDDLDAMIDLNQEVIKCCSWGVQICGAACLILSTHLTDEGLHVVLRRFEFALPSCIADLSDFLDLTIRHIERKNTFGILAGHSRQPISSMQRSTWYTPPENKQPRQPLHLTGHPPQSLTIRLLEEEMRTRILKNEKLGHVDEELGSLDCP
ncbi:hypothetical protein [Absidia glauca]|uniref:Uncharacterized protein n=1 Tax=Absidia glauca TaxID=4829 RepID=A0A163JI96_ABSGL|nr:hypothetical protein [Absidia glauca]